MFSRNFATRCFMGGIALVLSLFGACLCLGTDGALPMMRANDLFLETCTERMVLTSSSPHKSEDFVSLIRTVNSDLSVRIVHVDPTAKVTTKFECHVCVDRTFGSARGIQTAFEEKLRAADTAKLIDGQHDLEDLESWHIGSQTFNRAFLASSTVVASTSMASTTVLLAPILMGTPPRIDTSDDTPLLTFAIGGGIVAFLALGGVALVMHRKRHQRLSSPKAETATARSSVEPETPVKSRTKNSWMIPSPFARSSARSSSETKKKGAPKGTPARSVQTPQSAPPKYRGRAAIPMSPCGTIPLAPLRVTPPPLILSDENHVAVRLEPLSPFRKTPTHKPHSPGISRVASLTPKGAFHLAKLSPNLTDSPMSQSPTRSPTRDGEAWSPSPDAPGSPDTQRG